MSLPSLTIGMAGVSFAPFYRFEESQYRGRVAALEAFAKQLGCAVAAAPATFSDAEGAEWAARFLAGRAADLVVLDVCTFPEGKAVQTFFEKLSAPLALWARREDAEQAPIGHNSFCGANFAAGCLARLGRTCRKLYGSPGSAGFASPFKAACRLLRAAAAARGARIGLVGEGIVPKFHDLDVAIEHRAALEARWQITFVPIPLDTLFREARALDAAQVAAEAARERTAYRAVHVASDALRKQARLFLALQHIAASRELAALAIRCWPECQSDFGFWPCGAVGHLNEIGVPTACEGDPGGALDMLLASHLSRRPATLVDIVDFEDNHDAMTIWHCGPTAPSWAAGGSVDLIPHNVDGRDEHGGPRPGLPCVHDMAFEPGPITLFRTLGALDDEFMLRGRLVPSNGTKISGCAGRLRQLHRYDRSISAAAARDEVFARGLPHHFTAFYEAGEDAP